LTEHSPGPWNSSCYGDGSFIVRGHYGRIVCTRDRVPFPRREESEANARLIAAAPELLEALQKAREYVAKVNGSIVGAIGHDNTIVKPDLDLIDAAIAKAEGRP
jgi:hypothetical protein